jgi:uncharacterized protein (DUF4415 family)
VRVSKDKGRAPVVDFRELHAALLAAAEALLTVCEALRGQLAASDPSVGEGQANESDSSVAEAFASGMFKPVKVRVTTNIDADVLTVFKATGKGWQKRINAVLRANMPAGADGKSGGNAGG